MRSASLCQAVCKAVRQTRCERCPSWSVARCLAIRCWCAGPGLRQRERPGVLGNAMEEAVSIARVADLVSDGKQARAGVADRVPRGVVRAARLQRLGAGEPDERTTEHAAAPDGRAARDGIL